MTDSSASQYPHQQSPNLTADELLAHMAANPDMYPPRLVGHIENAFGPGNETVDAIIADVVDDVVEKPSPQSPTEVLPIPTAGEYTGLVSAPHLLGESLEDSSIGLSIERQATLSAQEDTAEKYQVSKEAISWVNTHTVEAKDEYGFLEDKVILPDEPIPELLREGVMVELCRRYKSSEILDNLDYFGKLTKQVVDAMVAKNPFSLVNNQSIMSDQQMRNMVLNKLVADEQYWLITDNAQSFPDLHFTPSQQQRALKTQAAAIIEHPELFPDIDITKEVGYLKETNQKAVLLEYRDRFPGYTPTLEDAIAVIDTERVPGVVIENIATFSDSERTVILDTILAPEREVKYITTELIKCLPCLNEADQLRALDFVASSRPAITEEFLQVFTELSEEKQELILDGMLAGIDSEYHMISGQFVAALNETQKTKVLDSLLKNEYVSGGTLCELVKDFGEQSMEVGYTLLGNNKLGTYDASNLIDRLAGSPSFDTSRVTAILYQRGEVKAVIHSIERLPGIDINGLVGKALELHMVDELVFSTYSNKIPGLKLDNDFAKRCILTGNAGALDNFSYKFDIVDMELTPEMAQSLVRQDCADFMISNIRKGNFIAPEDLSWITEELSELLTKSTVSYQFLVDLLFDPKVNGTLKLSRSAMEQILCPPEEVAIGRMGRTTLLREFVMGQTIDPGCRLDGVGLIRLLKNESINCLDLDTTIRELLENNHTDENTQDVQSFLTITKEMLGEEFIRTLYTGRRTGPDIMNIFRYCDQDLRQFIVDDILTNFTGQTAMTLYEYVVYRSQEPALTLKDIEIHLQTHHVEDMINQGMNIMVLAKLFSTHPGLFPGVTDRDMTAVIVRTGNAGLLFNGPNLSRFHDNTPLLNGVLKLDIDNNLADLMLEQGKDGASAFIKYEALFPQYPNKDKTISILAEVFPEALKALLESSDSELVKNLNLPFETVYKWVDSSHTIGVIIKAAMNSDVLALTVAQKGQIAEKAQNALLSYRRISGVDTVGFGQSILPDYLKLVRELPHNLRPVATASLIQSFSDDMIKIEDIELVQSLYNGEITAEISALGVSLNGEAGVRRLQNVFQQISSKVNSGQIDDELLTLLSSSSIARKVLMKITGFETSQWGSHGQDELARIIATVQEQRRQSPELLAINFEKGVRAEVAKITTRAKATDTEGVPQAAYVIPPSTQSRYQDIVGEIKDVTSKILTTAPRERRRAAFGVIDSEIEALTLDINGLIAELTKKRDNLAHPKAKEAISLQVNELTSVVDATRLKSTGSLREIKSFKNNFAVLSSYGELTPRVRKIAFAWSLLGNKNYTSQATLESLSSLPEIPDVKSMSKVIDFVDHIVNQETFSKYFDEEKDRQKFTKITSVQLLQEAIIKKQKEDLKYSGNQPVKTTTFEFVPDRGILMELSGHIGDACWASRYRSISQEYPNMTAVILHQNPADQTSKLAGSFMVIKTVDEATNTPMLVIRGLNPKESVINGLNPGSFLEAVRSYVAVEARKSGAKVGIVIDDHSGGSSTNRPVLFGYLSGIKERLERVKVPTEGTVFNGYNISNDVYVLPEPETK